MYYIISICYYSYSKSTHTLGGESEVFLSIKNNFNDENIPDDIYTTRYIGIAKHFSNYDSAKDFINHDTLAKIFFNINISGNSRTKNMLYNRIIKNIKICQINEKINDIVVRYKPISDFDKFNGLKF